jgi:hypothetical protein
VVTTLLMALSYALAFGALQHVPRIVPGLPDVRELAAVDQQGVVSAVQGLQEVGGMTGRILLALLAVRMLARPPLLRGFQIPALLILPPLFLLAPSQPWMFLGIGIFLGGLFTVGQFSFWGNYLPRVYPLHLRGTGESFAANVGGRMIGTSAALATTQLANVIPAQSPAASLSTACGLVALVVALAAIALSFWLPEPGREGLPD